MRPRFRHLPVVFLLLIVFGLLAWQIQVFLAAPDASTTPVAPVTRPAYYPPSEYDFKVWREERNRLYQLEQDLEFINPKSLRPSR